MGTLKFDTMIKTMVILASICLITSCIMFPKYTDTVKSYSYCFSEQKTGLDSLIDISGFYYMRSKSYNSNKYSAKQIYDTTNESFIFFSNGSFVNNFCSSCFFNANSQDLESNGGDWGIYKIFGDTIKAQVLNWPGQLSFDKEEFWFKIIDKRMLKLLAFKYRDPITLDHVEKFQNDTSFFLDFYCHFAPLTYFPNQDKSWLKNKKWFWCNKSDYKSWKSEQRKK